MSDYIINNFLEKNQEEAVKELECYNYCLLKAVDHIADNEMGKAGAYHENAARSLNELQRMINEKVANDQAMLILKQIESNQQLDVIKKAINQYEK